jgi:pSer/pThr/pTyr-binding forkhead associated (FHA) protein
VSRNHCRIDIEEEDKKKRLVLHDLDSSHGSRINGEDKADGKTLVKGDQLKLGKTLLIVLGEC